MEKQYTVGILTLGCKVNQYESEAIAERLEELGFKIASPTDVCDAYVINTCTVTAESDRKARQMIRRMMKNNPDMPAEEALRKVAQLYYANLGKEQFLELFYQSII